MTEPTIQELLTPYFSPKWRYDMVVSLPPGWEGLVREAHDKLARLDPDYRIVQIKEKFGGLRYYVASRLGHASETGRDMVGEIIADVELRSFETCERCGTQGQVTTETLGTGYHWLFTLCDPCRVIRKAEADARKAEYKLHRLQGD